MGQMKRYAGLLAIGMTLCACSPKGVAEEPAASTYRWSLFERIRKRTADYYAASLERLAAACRAMRGIVDFVEAVMAGTTRHFSAYSVGVYLDSNASGAAADRMLAGPTGDGGIYCSDSG